MKKKKTDQDINDIPKGIQVIRKIGQGFNQQVFLCSQNNRMFCVCIPLKTTSEKKWLRFSRKVATISHYLPKNNVRVARGSLIYTCGEWQLHEEYVSGNSLNIQMFNKLTPKQQAHFIFDFTGFMLDLNTMRINAHNELFGDIKQSLSFFQHIQFAYKYILHKIINCNKALSLILLNSYIKKRDIKRIEPFFQEYHFSKKAIKKYYSILDDIQSNKKILKLKGAYYGDLHYDNVLYDNKTHQLGIIDLAGTQYHGLLYRGLSRLLLIFGEEMSEQICFCYNQLAQKRNKTISLDFSLLKQCAVIEQSKRIANPKQAKILKNFLENQSNLFPSEIILHKETSAILMNLIKNC